MKDQLRIVFFADTHLGFDYPLEPRVERRRRGEDFFDNFRRVLDFAALTRPDLVVHGGDLFFRSRVSRKLVDMVYGDLLKFSELGIPLFMVPGNHERSSLPPSLWLSGKGVSIFDRPRTFCLEVSGTRIALSGFPFIRDNIRQQFNSVVADTCWQNTTADVRFLCMHQAVEGAKVGPADYTFRSGSDVVRISDIPEGFIAVLSGHIHRRQILWKPHREGNLPVIYPGSVERTSFAERDEPKGFYDLGITRNESGRWHVKRTDFIELPTRPMVDLEIDSCVECSSLHTYLREIAAKLGDNSIVRLRCRNNIDSSVKETLTATFLRSVFPASMNIQLGAEFYYDVTTNHSK